MEGFVEPKIGVPQDSRGNGPERQWRLVEKVVNLVVKKMKMRSNDINHTTVCTDVIFAIKATLCTNADAMSSRYSSFDSS